MNAGLRRDLVWSLVWGVVFGAGPHSGAARRSVSLVAGTLVAVGVFAALRYRRRRAPCAPDAGAPLLERASLAPGVWVLLMGCVALFLPTGVWLYGEYTPGIWRNGHGLFVPIAMGVLAARRLRADATAREESSPWGLPLLVLGAALAVADAGVRSGYVGVLGLLLLLPGLCLLLLGARRTRRLAFPLALGVFLMPLPERVPEPLALPSATAALAAPMLSALGFPVEQHLTVLVMREGPFNISTNCSGVATLYGALFFSLLLGDRMRSPLRRAALLLCSWPVTVFVNSLRAAFLLICADRFGAAIVDTPVHGLSGIGTFWGVMLLLFLIAGRPRFWRAEP
jgi:exosortase